MFSVHIIIIYRYILEYYTDWQDVDEDIATIPGQGGYWSHGLFVGVTQRHLFDFPTNVHDIVASKKNNIQPPSFTRRLCNVLYYNFT